MRSTVTEEELELMLARAKMVNSAALTVDGITAEAVVHETLRRRRDGDTDRQGDLSDDQLDQTIACYQAAYDLMTYAKTFLDLALDLRDRRRVGVTPGGN